MRSSVINFYISFQGFLSILGELIDFGLKLHFVVCIYTTPTFWHNFVLAFNIVIIIVISIFLRFTEASLKSDIIYAIISKGNTGSLVSMI